MRLSTHGLSPNELLHFIETSEFTASWKELGLNVEDDLAELQFLIMRGPKTAPVMVGTGGLRKLRFAPSSWQRSSSGAARICYAYFEKFGVVLLVIAYGKNTKANLSAREKLGIKRYLVESEGMLERISTK